MSEFMDQNELQCNIVLEEAPSQSSDIQTVRMVGFVMIDNTRILLSDLRAHITESLDDEQLQMIGTNFKFLKKNFPVSSKQEASMQIDKICINSTPVSSGSVSHIHSNGTSMQNTFILQPQHARHHGSHMPVIHDTFQTPHNSKPQSTIQSNKNSLIFLDENYEMDQETVNVSMIMNENGKDHVPKLQNTVSLTLDDMQPLEALPHHYQYMHSHIGASPIMNTSFLSNKGNSFELEDRVSPQNEEAFPKVTMRVSERQSSETFAMGKQRACTVMVRACHRVLSRRNSGDSDPTKPALRSFLELDANKTNTPVSVFTSFNNKARESRDTFDEKQDSDVEPLMSPKPLGFFKGSQMTASFIGSCVPLSPKSTRLETQLGHKLPRIGPKSSNKLCEHELSNEVDSILKNAMVHFTVEEDDSNNGIKLEETDEGSTTFSISVDETVKLRVSELPDAAPTIVPLARPPQDTTCTPPQTFVWTGAQRTNTFRFAGKRPTPGDHLVDDNIKTKLTVIGHPMDTSDGNVMLSFDNATDLIKGLGGVHHSRNNPLWLDLVCDRNTFVTIAEHIRPAIHTLTIEDCLTIDCREKLEIFNEYLFVCLKTCDTLTHSIHVLIFKTMIITYHLGHDITSDLMNDCRFLLNKKFGNICPSPSWVGHTIIDNVIDKMMPEVESRVREVETCEQFVFKLCNESQNELLHRMQNVRSWMVLYRSRLWPKSTITHNLLNNCVWRKDFLCDVPLPYWRDINDHVARMVDLLELGTQTLESIQNIFVAKVSLEMTQQSNSLASVGGKLAGVGAVFLPLTVITGIWGMNCRVPFQFNPGGDAAFDDNLYGFVIVMLIMLLSSIITWQCVNQKGFVEPKK